jgi:hypothetical protein
MDEWHRSMVTQAVAPAFTDAPPPALIGLLASLLDFRSWQTLTDQFGLAEPAAAEAMANAARLLLDGYASA